MDYLKLYVIKTYSQNIEKRNQLSSQNANIAAMNENVFTEDFNKFFISLCSSLDIGYHKPGDLLIK